MKFSKKNNSSLLVIFLMFVIFNTNGQVGFSAEEKEMLSHQHFENHKYSKRHVKFGFGNNNKILDYSFGSLMFIYQKYLSKQISADCLYSPTCSGYSKLLFKTYRPSKAFLATMDRLMRCDRLSAADLNFIDVDPITFRKHEDETFYGKFKHKSSINHDCSKH